MTLLPAANKIVYRPGRMYLVRSWVTGEGNGLLVHEVLPYEGHVIVLGENTGRKTLTWRGVKEWEGRPTWFCAPRIRDRLDAATLQMVLVHAGGDGGSQAGLFGTARLSEIPPGSDIQVEAYKGVQFHGDEEPVLTINRTIATAWHGQPWLDGEEEGWKNGRTVNRDGMVLAARKTLRLFDECRRSGYVPPWFRREKREILAAAQARNLHPPEAPTPKLYLGGGGQHDAWSRPP